MSRFEGKFTNTKNEKLDEFYTAIGKLISYLKVVLCCYYRNLFSIGIPWVPRKMMTASSPTIEISVVDGVWTIKTSTLMSNSSVTFKLGEEYIETMPGGRTIKVPTVASNFFFHYLIFSLFKQNVTTVEDNKLITNSQSDRGASTK